MAKKRRKLKPAKTRKNKPIKTRKRVLAAKKVKKKKIILKSKPVKKIKKLASRIKKPKKRKKIHPVKSRKAGISPKAKLFNRVGKKNIPAKPPAEFPAQSLFKARIKVIGVGGGGGSIVSEIGRSLEKATFVIADTDIRALKRKSGIKYFWFGENFTHGLGTGVNVELAKKAAEEAREKISNIFKDQDIVIFIASLGGGIGSEATQVFAEFAREFGGITLGIFTLPFKFEGKNKSRIAGNALKELRKSLNVSITIPNEKIFKVIDANTSITEAFSIVNKNLIESLESLIDIIYNPGLINIDFADLRTILKGRGNLAFLNTVEESGKDRADKVINNILVNPLYQGHNFTAEKILFNISAGRDLSMFEVEKISKSIADLNPKSKIIFGISKNSKLKNKIKTTLLMTGPGKDSELAKEEIKPVEIIIKKASKIEQPKEAILKKKSKIKGKKKVFLPESPKDKLPEILVPVFQPSELAGTSFSEEKKLSIIDSSPVLVKKTIRRSALDIKEAEALEEKKKQQQEKEWEIPAFLRKVKFKS